MVLASARQPDALGLRARRSIAASQRRRGRGGPAAAPQPRLSGPVFDTLSEKLQATLADVRSRGTLTEADVSAAMREIRLALLEADVNFKVVKSFTTTVKERCLGSDVLGQLNPGQQVVKIVNEELTALMGGSSAGIALLLAPADGDPHGRPAGLRQDDRVGQARALLDGRERLVGRARGVRRLPPGGGRPADQGRRPGRRDGLLAGDRLRSRRHRQVGAGSGQARRQGRADRRHRRAPAHRREADGRARRDPQGGQADDRAARRRRDDRPGRRQRRRAVRLRGRLRRRADVQARRRRPRRRRAVGQGRHRQADPVRLDRREARPVRALPSRPHGAADPRHGRRAVVHREGRGADRRGRGAASSSASCAATSSPSRTSSRS